MGLLFRKLKKYTGLIVLIVLILFGQALAELSLPDYMAKIVNVGISQGGVDTRVPLILSQDSMDKMKIILDENDFNKLNGAYELTDGSALKTSENKFLRKIPEGNKVWKLKTNDSLEDKDLMKIMDVALILKGSIDGELSQEAMGANMSGAQSNDTGNKTFNFPKGEAGYNQLKMFPNQIKNSIKGGIEKFLTTMPESNIGGITGRVIALEYEKAGLDKIAVQNDYMTAMGIRMMGTALLALLASLSVGLIASRIAADFGKELRTELFSKVISFSDREFNKFSTASLITRSNNDIQQVQNMLVMLLRIIFYAPILGFGGIYKAVTTNVSMAWIIGLGIIIIIAVVSILFAVAMPLFKKVQNLVDRLQLVTREILNGLMVIRAFVTRDYEEKRFEKANRNLTDTNQAIANVMILMNPILMLIMNGVMLMIIWVGAHEINKGSIQVGDMMAFIQYAMQIIMAFLMITMVSIMFPRAQISLNRVDEVLKEEPSIVNPNNPVELPQRVKGNIEFKNVSFKFDNAPLNTLENINLEIKPGETTAFIGSTGSGKSTLVSLIPRFYDVTEGQILLDGHDIRNIDIHDLRDRIGFVPQKATLFTGTISSNMKIGKNHGLNDEAINKSLNIAQASEFIKKLPKKEESPITQGGTNVSGGQKQRLSIARALASSPEIYIFDDSFSALDFKTDLELRRALKKEAADATVIIVAQRIGTILKADKIVVMEEGKINGVGTHEELLKNNEVYREIASSQLKKEDLA